VPPFFAFAPSSYIAENFRLTKALSTMTDRFKASISKFIPHDFNGKPAMNFAYKKRVK